MTADILLLLVLSAATMVTAGLGALLVGFLGQIGWFIVAASLLAAGLACRLTWTRLAATADWRGEDLRDEWRAG